MGKKIRHAADKALEKIVSRKLLAWATATGLMIWGNLESGDWIILSAVYIGGQTVVDSVVALRRANRSSNYEEP